MQILFTTQLHIEMVEPTGITFGVLGLAGVFTDAVKCLHCVELGKSFNDDYMTSILRLEMLGLQLSRWGEAVGLSAVISDNDRLAEEHDDEKKRLIQETLIQICSSLEKAEEDSRKITGIKEEEPKEFKDAGLMNKLQSLSLERIPKTKSRFVSEKTKWALHRRETFNNLVEGLQQLIQGLIETFPPPADATTDACQHEVAEVMKIDPEYVKLM